MTTTTTTTARRLAAVRVGHGTATHAGYLSRDPGRYVPACGAGRYFPDENTPLVVQTGEPVSEPVTCGNCKRRHPEACTSIALALAQDDPAALVAPESMNTAQGVLDGPAAQRMRAALAADPAAAVPPSCWPVYVAGRCRYCGGSDVHTFTCAGRRVLADDAPVTGSPADIWGRIIVATANADPYDVRRLRVAWIVGAIRRAYDLPERVSDGTTPDPEAVAAIAADRRDMHTRARAFLAEYAARLDERATDVDRLALAFAAPDDQAQRDAGTRPVLGSWVSVADMPGRWRVVARSTIEQRRDPWGIRVQQDGHPLNGSVPLSSVEPCDAPPATPATDQGTRPPVGDGWLPVAVAPGYDRRRDVVYGPGGYELGEVWRQRNGLYLAYRRGFGTPMADLFAPATTRGDALASVGWLPTVPAWSLVGPHERRYRGDLPDTSRPRVVLSDGSVFIVERAHRRHRRQTDANPRPGVWPVRWLRLVVVTGHLTGGTVRLVNPYPTELVPDESRATLGPKREGPELALTWHLVMNAGTRLALTPPCTCGAHAGETCAIGCPEDVEQG